MGILKCFIIAKSGLFLCFGLQYYLESKVSWADRGVSTIPAVAPVAHTEVSATHLNHWEYQKPLGLGLLKLVTPGNPPLKFGSTPRHIGDPCTVESGTPVVL